MLTGWFNIIKRIGLQPDRKGGDVKRLMVVNSFSFITAILCAFCGVTLAWISGDWSILYTALGFVCGFLSILAFNRIGWYGTAKFSLMFVFCMVMLYYGATFGESTQVHFLGLFLIGVPLLICTPDEQELRFMCLLMILVCLALLETNYYYQLISPMEMSRQELFFFRWLIMSVVLTLNFMVIRFYQLNITGLLKRLQKKNESLNRKNDLVLRKEAELKQINAKLSAYNEHLAQEVEARTSALTQGNMIMEEMISNLKNSNRQLREQDNLLTAQLKELEEAREALVQARDTAEKANLAKSAYLREISHEIRNPLNAVIGMTYLLLNEIDNRNRIPQNALAYIESISTSGHTLLEIVNNVLELARIEAGKIDQVQPEPFNLRDWLRGVSAIYQNAAQVKDVAIQLQIDNRLPSIIYGDRVHLTQIVNNLLGNAIKFSPEKKKVTLHCFRKESMQWCIRVSDEGIGIPEDKQRVIFQPFEQADASIQENYGGTGLGLTITRRIAEMMGGSITVWSHPGAGTAFTVTLPLNAESVTGGLQPLDNTTAAQHEYAAFPDETRVLLMEDSEINQLIMQRFFSNVGVTLHVANNGEDGLALARKVHPDIIIMDMHMPRMTGLEVIVQLRKDPVLAHIPVIAISADAFHEQQDEAKNAGVNEYLIKPIEFDRLYNVISQYLHRQSQFRMRVIKAS